MAWSRRVAKRAEVSSRPFLSSETRSMKQLSAFVTLAFDPRPFIATFESAIESLHPLRGQVASRTTEVESDVLSAEKGYSSKLTELRENFEVCNTGQ
jgi:hypothetical protein